MASKSARWAKLWPPAVVLGALLALWQAAASLGLVDAWRIPSPIAVTREAIDIWPRLMAHTWATLKLTLIGFAGGSAAGFALAALLHLLPGVRRGVYPLLILSQNVPIVVLGPILTMLFGYGLLPKVMLVMLVCFFPVSIAMMAGLSNTDAGLRHYMRMIGAGKRELFWRLELPNAVVHLFSGLKIAASYSVLSAVFAELLSPKLGLGGFMALSSRGFMPERAFAAVILIIIVSLTLFGLVAWAERIVIRWRPSAKEGGKRHDA
ncbi:ABC transporter permease subunit [Paenibacillus sp. LHD-117]|uniref:ABC transporter permease n=1 Tax=Paenibacillus sp. LHD-117 TaxID=3071412 RepID=UPI0027E1E1BA|nr:ABC transporter permease subunit [Paenibacillus sp. LHD-117]MDQ6420802.1 ABC transporter permease subunit [Paenibacillus sp. LHD-117]